MAATIEKRTYWIVFASLMGLLIATVGISFIHLGGLGTIVAYAIAATKGLLIMLFFMHVKKSSHLTWAFAGSAFLWLGILFVLSLSDYTTRGWQPSGEELTHKVMIPPPQKH